MSAEAASFDERFVAFDCEGSACIGVLSGLPASAATPAIGVVIVVGGPQYRVGSHRQFVLLARALGEAGIPSLRFDYRGMGDSDGDARSFEAIDADIAAAVDVLCRESSVARVVLWGLCDGASAALMYAPADPRIAGIVALNPWARSVQGEATVRLKHYYVKRLLSVEFWRKVATGGFNVRRGADDFAGALSGALRSNDRGTSVPFLRRMEEGWGRFGRPTLFLLSGNDLTAREFEDWVAASAHRRALLGAASTELAEFPEADHTFSSRALRDAVAARTIEWIGRACRPS